MKKNRVLLGMSGGVDSSVAAYILKEKGYEVIGATMQIWPDQDDEIIQKHGGCCSLSAVDDARRVADKIGIPFYVMNFKDIFEKKVINYFVDEYLAGRTPNPCIACNRYIKFQEFLRRAESLEAFFVATGHYARICFDEVSKKYTLKKSVTISKDQTYALYNMSQYHLEHTLFPLGEFTKDEVRSIAKDIGLTVANKPDSQEICFVQDNNYTNFLKKRIPDKIKPGNFVDTKGRILGQHKGIVNYTIGQRKGLGIAFGEPMYVIEIDSQHDIIVLGKGEEVFSEGALIDDINIISGCSIDEKLDISIKIRYNSKETRAKLIPQDDNTIKAIFDIPQRAVTPGQSAVFYIGDTVLGGGIITKAINAGD